MSKIIKSKAEDATEVTAMVAPAPVDPFMQAVIEYAERHGVTRAYAAEVLRKLEAAKGDKVNL